MAARSPVTVFADPYKQCLHCGGWIDGAADSPGPLTLIPCGHRCGYRDVCPSWSPVDGCNCAVYTAANPHRPIFHDMRTPPAVIPPGVVYGPAPTGAGG